MDPPRSGRRLPRSGLFFEVNVLGDPSPLLRGKFYGLFFVEGCQRPGYTFGFVPGRELLLDHLLKRDCRLFHAASSTHGKSIVTYQV